MPKKAPSPQHVVAESRERFLTSEAPAPETVRDTILASWRRSQELHVAADKIEMSFEPDVQLDTRLSRSALPVLRTLGQQLEGQSVSVILTDASGLVLTRITGDRALESHLDQVLLAPGFSYAEKFVGTNGIGTALEMGGPAHVFGHEHYAEHLEDLACAGVPIHHPITGRLVGAVDFTCWRRDAGALLLTLAKTTAEQIRQSLLADAGSSELGLFREYLRTCGRGAGIVFALNNDVVMLNDFARTVIDPVDQAALLARAGETLTNGRPSSVVISLPSGQTARMYSRPVDTGDLPAGIVAHVKLDPPDSPATGLRPAGPPAASRHRRHRSPVAQRLRGSRTGFPLGRVAGGGGRARSRETGCPHRRAAASATGRPPPGRWTPSTTPVTRNGCRVSGEQRPVTPIRSSCGTSTLSMRVVFARSPRLWRPRASPSRADRCGWP